MDCDRIAEGDSLPDDDSQDDDDPYDKVRPPSTGWYRSQAIKRFHREGDLEIDEGAVVSQCEDGAYVQAWIWIEDPIRMDLDPEAWGTRPR